MSLFPLEAVLFWIAVTLAPQNAVQIHVKGPDTSWAWTRQAAGWSFSIDRAVWNVEGNAVTFSRENDGKKAVQDVAEFVRGIKGHDWAKSPTLELEPHVSLVKEEDAWVYTRDAATATAKRYVIRYRRKPDATTPEQPGVWVIGNRSDILVITPEKREAVVARIRQDVEQRLKEFGATYDRVEVTIEDHFDSARVSYYGLKGFTWPDGTISGNAEGHFTLQRSGSRWQGRFGTVEFDVSTADILGKPGSMKITSPSPAHSAFSPVVERTVNVAKPSLDNCMIDFASGKLLSMSERLAAEDARPTEEDDSWLKENHVDAIGQAMHVQYDAGEQAMPGGGQVFPESNKIGLIGIDMTAVRAENSEWTQITAAELRRRLALANSARPNPGDMSVDMTTDRDFPATWLFQNRDGREGILQVLGLEGEPLGVKIRYKLVQQNGGDVGGEDGEINRNAE